MPPDHLRSFRHHAFCHFVLTAFDSLRTFRTRRAGARIDPHGFDAGKLIKSKKRHILVDLQGATLFGQFRFLAKLFADSAYAGSIFHTALGKVLPNLKTEIVRRSDRAKGFTPLTQALDRPTYDCLAEPLPPTGQGLGEPQS